MQLRTPASLVATASLVLAALLPTPADAGSRAGRWAAPEQAPITPGVQMFTRGAQCTGNFVFTDAARRVYVGYAAHCAGTGEATDINGCRNPSLPLGTKVRFASGATAATGGTTVGRGRLAYSSWETMQALGTTGHHICHGNDFALVRVGRKHEDKVNPTVPFWGGPTGLAGAPGAGRQVHSWGESSLRPTTVLSPKTGVSLGTTYGGWAFDAYTATPGVPGDSGSGVLDDRGRAVGSVSTVAVAPFAGSNGVGTLKRELAFAQRWSGIRGLRLVRGTEPFAAVP
ncbi:hypothetical protein [Nocardioides coralli]|uniref:hypothetical protein n=1 Tax=Nocardioides coralli TaxID=2872154 RepID=UPI001CA3CB00|nr:hypothetical protein [Nocardioides coralli]QZY30064.1 hypothetical protein K6T13_05110 [Nocardioides coralli]